MKNILVLAGGIGNQLFQIAAANHLFPENYLVYEKSLLNYKNIRTSINGILLDKNEVYSGSKLFDKIIKSKITYKVKFPFFWKDYSIFFRIKFMTDYYQCCKLYGESILKTSYNIKIFNSQKIEILCARLNISFDTSLAIHLRFGDYKDNSKFWILDLEYLKKSIYKFKSIRTIYIFCNDDIPDKFLDYFKSLNIKIYYIKTFKMNDVDEFLLMSAFRKIIISNSTFSFWAALVGDNNKQVIAPSRFYSNIKKNKSWVFNCKYAKFDII